MSGRLSLRPANSIASARRCLSAGLLVLSLLAAYLYAFPQPTILYAAVVLLHALVGIATTLVLIIFLYPLLENSAIAPRLGWILVAGGAILGLILIKTGTPRSESNLLYVHILLSLSGAGILFAEWAAGLGWSRGAFTRSVLALFVLGLVGLGARYLRVSEWRNRGRIENATLPPASMNQEGDGPQGRFFPVLPKCMGSERYPASSSWSRTPVSAVMRTSTTSGSGRPIIFLPSITSGTARALNTCKIRSAPGLPNGAEDVTIQPCFTAG